MNELENKKQDIFKTTLNVFKKYDDTTDTTRARNYWSEYAGMIKVVAIMGWEREFVEYSLANGWDVMLP